MFEALIVTALIIILFTILIMVLFGLVNRRLDKQEAERKAQAEKLVQTLEAAIALNTHFVKPTGSVDAAQEAFKYVTGNPRHMKFYWGVAVPAEEFYQKLLSYFDKVEVFCGKPANDPRFHANINFELTKGSSKAILNATSTWRLTTEIQGFEGSSNVKFWTRGLKKPTDKPIGDTSVPVLQVVRDLTLFYVPGEDVKPDTVSSIVEELKLEFVLPPIPAYNIYEIVGTSDGNFYKQAVRKTPPDLLSHDTLDLHYMPFQVRTKKGKNFESVKVKPSAFIPAMINLVEKGGSIAMGHLTGAAKTVLARHMITTLAKRADVNVFIMDAARMELFSSPHFGTYAADIFPPEEKNIIFLDQAESVLPSKVTERNPEDPNEIPLSPLASKLLGLIDGFEREQYNLSFIFVYNGSQKYWHPAFTRKGRLLNVDVELLDVPHAQDLLKHIVSTADMRDKEVDVARFNDLCENPNGVSVADVYGCLVDKDISELLSQELKEAAVPTVVANQPFGSPTLKEAVEAPKTLPLTSQQKGKAKNRSRRRRR